VWVDEHGATTVPGLYAAGDLACVPHNYMIGAFVFGDLAGTHATGFAKAAGTPAEPPADQVAAAHELIYRPLRNPGGPPQQQVEYKLRRFVNDYVAPPKSGAKLTIAVETFDRMRGEIAAMGAETPHELMRCVEVSFIRDCAEMAARSSLVRTESRWGLYHERLDHPDRDDDSWLYHLNLRRRADGLMEFLKRPVAEYLIPVDGFEVPQGRTVEVLGPVAVTAEPGSVTATAPADEPVAAAPTSPRIVELLALTEEQPDLARIEPYLADADLRVRRTAVAILTELSPVGTGLGLAGMLSDDAQDVRAAAAHGLRELVSVLTADDPLRQALLAAGASPDPLVRVAVLDLLRELRIGDRATFAAGLADPRSAVRLSAVHGLVSQSAGDLLADAAADPAREVRVAVAAGIGALADPRAAPTLATLAGDVDPLVQEQALTTAAAIGCPPPFPRLAVEALRSPNWRVRVGAATALGGADREAGLEPLRLALRDTNLDVRKAAVQALAPWSGDPEVDEALADAATDVDADVRAYARSALARVRA
jgi:HEAT repeat protein